MAKSRDLIYITKETGYHICFLGNKWINTLVDDEEITIVSYLLPLSEYLFYIGRCIISDQVANKVLQPNNC